MLPWALGEMVEQARSHLETRLLEWNAGVPSTVKGPWAGYLPRSYYKDLSNTDGLVIRRNTNSSSEHAKVPFPKSLNHVKR